MFIYMKSSTVFIFHHFFLDQETPDVTIGNKYIML